VPDHRSSSCRAPSDPPSVIHAMCEDYRAGRRSTTSSTRLISPRVVASARRCSSCGPGRRELRYGGAAVDLANRRGISRHSDARGACAALRRCPRPPPADHHGVDTGAGHGRGLRCAWTVRPRPISPVGTSPHGAGNRDSSHVPRRGHLLDRHVRLAVVARHDVHPCRSSNRDLTSSVAGDTHVAMLYVEDVRTNRLVTP
jgi:hypothetical protein